ncbi:hypothetical protein TTHERM_001230168 (macronuclear) [Tetrahymena thermophila SB210]|uniref:Uncharacterized protein n=1 Tax=Tetrahymena thermophila (strain SB210) TaxID=312017 RepID=W7X144_TETTS|nr:hypothetical protein TTHERM_001230168 [Tetrahymena thermophila SB210]EWS72905.1 hypothetical protein TTHERM_001230168 [Tetrahymena thermophila SB210]|eukprot:XP_012654560.1 hypothetical protein TTHERM_001230168 [Tetrahymena thermophila SB210]
MLRNYIKNQKSYSNFNLYQDYQIILDNSQGSFCVQLNPNIEQQIAKNTSNDFCQSIQQQAENSVNCAYNYCLNENYNCVPLSNQDGYRGFCIYNNQCVPISGIYLGKDENQKCVTSLQCTNYPIPQLIDCQFSLEICFENNQCYFLNDVSGTGCSSQSLVQMYGADMDGNCLQQYQMQAIKCSSGYCIINNYCQKYNNQYVGRDKNYNCLKEKQITAIECENQFCLLHQRILKSNPQQCITIDSPNQPASTCAYGQYCKDPVTLYCVQMQPGYCQSYKQSNCKSCPDQTCKNNSQQTCVEMINLQLLSNQCIIKQRPDVPCQIIDTNQYLNQILVNPSYPIQCTNTLRMCQNLSKSSQFCQSCPINFIQPGNGKCYNLEEQQENQYNSNSFYSFLNTIYISESFGVEDSQQCPYKNKSLKNHLHFYKKLLEH